MEPLAAAARTGVRSEFAQSLFIRAFFLQGETLRTAQVHIFQIGNSEFRKLSAAGGAVCLMPVQYMDALTVFAVMNVHHDEFLLFSHSVTVFRLGQEKAFDKKGVLRRGKREKTSENLAEILKWERSL